MVTTTHLWAGKYITVLSGVSSSTLSDAFSVEQCGKHTFQVVQTGSGSISVQGSLDGVTFTPFDSLTSKTGIFSTSFPMRFVKVNATVSSGTLSCFYYGLRE